MKRPVILISMSNVHSPNLENITGDTEIIYSDKATADAVKKAGGIPIYIPTNEHLTAEELEIYLQMADGVAITGADTNTNPIHYGESSTHIKGRIDNERDIADIALVQSAYKKDLPLLAICKGMQISNVALGGTLYQDIEEQLSDALHHDVRGKRNELTHSAKLSAGSILQKIFKSNQFYVNGGHQQGIKKLSDKLLPTAIAEDGIIEAYEAKDKRFFMGIQFHAELRPEDPLFFKIFTVFIKNCKK